MLRNGYTWLRGVSEGVSGAEQPTVWVLGKATASPAWTGPAQSRWSPEQNKKLGKKESFLSANSIVLELGPRLPPDLGLGLEFTPQLFRLSSLLTVNLECLSLHNHVSYFLTVELHLSIIYLFTYLISSVSLENPDVRQLSQRRNCVYLPLVFIYTRSNRTLGRIPGETN